MRYLNLLAMLAVLCFTTPALAHGSHGGGFGGGKSRNWLSLKKAEAQSLPVGEIVKLVPGVKKIKPRSIPFTKSQLEEFEKTLGEPLPEEDKEISVFLLKGKWGKELGSVLFFDVSGSQGEIELGLALSPDGKISRVMVLANENDPAAPSPKFLEQFSGKKKDDRFRVGEDVSAPSGTEEQAQKLTSAIHRELLLGVTALRLGQN